MNNQIILPLKGVVFIKTIKNNKINYLNLILNLKYIWKVLISWYLFRRKKSKPVWIQFKGSIDFNKKSKKVKKCVDKIFNIN